MEKVRRWLDERRSSKKRKENHTDAVSILANLKTNLPKCKLEFWRSERQVDCADPMSIKRTEPQRKRRVAFHDISVPLKTTKLDGADTDVYGFNNNINAESTESLASSVSSQISVHEEQEIMCEQFVSAFGRKGKQIGRFEDAKDITCLPENELIITDFVLGRLQKFTKNSKSVTLFASGETTPPWATAMTPDGYIAVTMCNERCVKVLSMTGECVFKFGEDVLRGPRGIICDSNGNFIVTDEKIGQVFVFDRSGDFIRLLGDSTHLEEQFVKPRYVCVNINNDTLVSDSGTHSVKIFHADGNYRKSFGAFGRKDGQLKCPYGVCTNSTGEIFVADHYNNRISVFTKDGVFVRHVINNCHGLYHPQGIAIDANNYLFVTHGQFKATEILTFKLTAKVHDIDID